MNLRDQKMRVDFFITILLKTQVDKVNFNREYMILVTSNLLLALNLTIMMT